MVVIDDRVWGHSQPCGRGAIEIRGVGERVLYHWYELGHAAVRPARVAASTCSLMLRNPFNPLAHTTFGRSTAAACDVFERTTRRYGEPEFGLTETMVAGQRVRVRQRTVWAKPFCRLLHFDRQLPRGKTRNGPHILLIAPMSGHHATLLRGTVETLLADHEVYITDWVNAHDVPVSEGGFDLDDYIDYLIEMFALFDGRVHVAAVCQPSVPALAAVSLLEARRSRSIPRSLTLLGGPIDTRIRPTAVNELARKRDIDWFRRNVISRVPWPSPGAGREVYPGFLQLTGFMTMNLDRHIHAHKDLFLNLIRGDGDSVEKHREFYDEYLAVMDLTAEFYLQTVKTVFMDHALPKGEMKHRGEPVEPASIRRVPLFTLEGELDDITGRGQCRAAHDLCTNLRPDRHHHFEQPGVGHYGVFNGRRFRTEIAPRLAAFFRAHEPGKGPHLRLEEAFVRTMGRPALRSSLPLAVPHRSGANRRRQKRRLAH